MPPGCSVLGSRSPVGLPRGVDVPDDPRGIPEDNHLGRHVLRDDGTGADHRARADAETGQNHGPGANRGATLDPRLEHLRLILLAPGILVVRKRRVRSDEHVVGDPKPVPQLHAAFHRDTIAENDVVLDEDVVADVAVPSDARARQHVRERPDSSALADRRALAERLRM